METSTSSSSSSSATPSIAFYDFLERMRNPTSLDLVRSIKSFIVSFSFYSPNPENDGKKVQEFFTTMEAAIRDHPVWTGATDEEVDSAMEGLEKYVMTKLFSRTFSSSQEDAKIDLEISEKISMLQTFLKPEHLDIPSVLRNEASWLLAEKELQKLNAFRTPREKLLCIFNCCKVINNLLLNASISEDHMLGGADDFLPVLIYVTIKANPPQLHSNLRFIQLYRRQAKLVSEAAYYFTNLVSAKTFIVDLNAKSLSMNEIEFEESMQAARLTINLTTKEPMGAFGPVITSQAYIDHGNSARMHDKGTGDNPPSLKMKVTTGGSNYPYMEAEAGELTVRDVEKLLSLYKDVVSKYTNLSRVVRHHSVLKTVTLPPHLKGTEISTVASEGTSANSDKKRE